MPFFSSNSRWGSPRRRVWLIAAVAALLVVGGAIAAVGPLSGSARPAVRVYQVMNAADYPAGGVFLDPAFTDEAKPAATLTDLDLVTVRCSAMPTTPLPLAWGTDTVWYLVEGVGAPGTGWLSAHFIRGAVAGQAISGVVPCGADLAPPSFDTPKAIDALLFGPLADFLQARSDLVADGLLDWSSDDCSAPLNEPTRSQPQGFDFRDSCRRHDFGYRNDKAQNRLTEDVRQRIDDNLKSDLYTVCAAYTGWQAYRGVECRRIADVYYVAVRSCGQNPAGFCPDRITALFDFLR